MADESDEARALALLAESAPLAVDEPARARFLAALEAERYLPFCRELAARFALAETAMRALLATLVDPAVWTPGEPPVHSFVDFTPGPALSPLRAGFVRLSGGAGIARHQHADRELTMVLEGAMVDDQGRRFVPGDVLEMASGSVHTLTVPEGIETVVALLHGRIEVLGR
ncbi:MAG TPA: cupin domain-containing protein [Polyangiaceae bacterium]|nr:cupin domain-containing protein [Polyangiaceae bacterium]